MSTNLDDPVVQAIVAARVKLLLEKPFFGNLATRLKLVDASSWCKTAATEGRHFYYNREFIKGLTPAELLFLIGHEVLHCVYDHMGRKGGRDHKIHNMAADYIVNYTLHQEQVGKMPTGGLYEPDKYTDEMTSEEVYELLMKNSTVIKMPLDMHLDGSGGEGDEDGDGNSDGGVEVRVMGKDGPPKLTQEDMDQIRNEIRAATIQAAQAAGADKTPAGVKRLIDAFTQPKMDWRALLDTHIQSALKDDFTFSKINKRSWNAGVILPGMNYMNTIDIAIAIDTSGSMTEEMLRDILGEVKGIMETFKDFKLTLWTFDTSVYNVKTFTHDNLDEILEYEPQGGGGTLFECNWDFMKEEGLEPHRFVMFTDGYPGGSWGDENYVDTLFVIHGTTSITAPFGLTAYYELGK
jgi:predicted metal-dependent peptidase